MSRHHKFPIPSGFTWSHAADAYTNAAGDVWNDHTNVIRDKYGNVLGARIPPDAIEQEIQRKGLTAPRVKPEDIEAVIAKEEYITRDTLTICVLTCKNGFTAMGESACASPENFDEALGRKIARKAATDKLWPVLGYALREKLATQEKQL